MATPRFRGSAVDIRQIATLTISGTWLAADTITLTIDNLDVVITIGSLVTTAQVATTVQQAFSGSAFTDTTATVSPSIAQGGPPNIGEFAEITASVASSVVSFTTNQTSSQGGVGKPFTMSAAKSSASGTISYSNAATAATGQNDGTNQDNYTTNAAPANNDNVVFDAGSVDLLYGLSLGCQPATITKLKAYSGNVGLREINRDKATSSMWYQEYRTKYLTTTNNSVTTTANLEQGTGNGSKRFRWDAGAGQVVLNLFGKSTREDTAVPCVLFIGTHASNVVNNIAGDLGICFYPGEAATVATLNNGDGPSSVANTEVGTGATLTTVVCNGGTLSTSSAITTATQNGGVWKHNTGTVTTANVLGGSWKHLGAATITTLNVGSGGTFDARGGTATFVITNPIQLYKGAKFYDPQGRAGNVVFKLNQCSLADVTIVLAANKTYTLS